MSANFMPAQKRYKKAGAMIRTNKPIVGTDYALVPQDLGVVVNAAGSHVTLPPINLQMQGEVYTVKNISSGDITAGPCGNDKITTAGGPLTQMIIPSDDSFDFDVETTTGTWVIR